MQAQIKLMRLLKGDQKGDLARSSDVPRSRPDLPLVETSAAVLRALRLLREKLTKTESLFDLLELSAREGAHVLGADRLCVYLWDGAHKQLLPAHAYGERESRLSALSSLAVNPQQIQPMANALFDARKPVAVSDAGRHAWFPRSAARRFLIRSLWAGPILDASAGKLYGALVAHQTGFRRTVGRSDLEAIEAVGRVLGEALSRQVSLPPQPMHFGEDRARAQGGARARGERAPVSFEPRRRVSQVRSI